MEIRPGLIHEHPVVISRAVLIRTFVMGLDAKRKFSMHLFAQLSKHRNQSTLLIWCSCHGEYYNVQRRMHRVILIKHAADTPLSVPEIGDNYSGQRTFFFWNQFISWGLSPRTGQRAFMSLCATMGEVKT